MLKKIVTLFGRHRIFVGVSVVVLIGGTYWALTALNKPATEVRYVLGTAQKGALISTVSGSGQVAALNQVDVKSKVSGDVLNVLTDSIDVKSGTVLAMIDDRDAQKTVRDAQSNWESSVLALEKLKKPADSYSILQAQNAVDSARNALSKLQQSADASSVLQAQNTLKNAQDVLSKLVLSQPTDLSNAQAASQKATDNTAKAYEDAFNEIANTFLDLPTIMTDVDGILHNTDIINNESNSMVMINDVDVADRPYMQTLQTVAENDEQTARALYDKTFTAFKASTRYSDRITVESLLQQTIDTTKQIAQATKSESNYMDAWVDYRTQKHYLIYLQIKTNQTKASTDIGKVNGHLSALLSSQQTVKDNNQAVITATSNLSQLQQNQPLDLAAAKSSVQEKESTLAKLTAGADPIDIANAKALIAEKESALAKLKAGADPLDVQTQQLMVEQKANALTDAKTALADYSIVAPFDGVVASVPVKKGDAVSPSTVIVTLITKQRIAEISLNEVDAAKIQVGDKATLTFDAIDGLQVTGEVVEIQSIGTVTQGVVSYTAKIVFDTQDGRVKPGMSTSAAIITQAKQDVITVDNGAIKTQGDGTTYVELVTPTMIKETNNQGVTLNTSPEQRMVTVGISNDTSTEIVDGLKEGDQVITRTIRPTTTTTITTQAPSLLGTPNTGNRGGGAGGTFRGASGATGR